MGYISSAILLYLGKKLSIPVVVRVRETSAGSARRSLTESLEFECRVGDHRTLPVSQMPGIKEAIASHRVSVGDNPVLIMALSRRGRFRDGMLSTELLRLRYISVAQIRRLQPTLQVPFPGKYQMMVLLFKRDTIRKLENGMHTRLSDPGWPETALLRSLNDQGDFSRIQLTGMQLVDVRHKLPGWLASILGRSSSLMNDASTIVAEEHKRKRKG